jgi:hypothetical protein
MPSHVGLRGKKGKSVMGPYQETVPNSGLAVVA